MGLLVVAAVSTALLVGALAYDSLSTFTLQPHSVTLNIKYQRGWSLTRVAFQGGQRHRTSGDSQVGFGNQSLTATFYSSPSPYGVSICAWVGKLDGSNASLLLDVYSYPAALALGEQQTTAPFGIVRVCGEVLP